MSDANLGKLLDAKVQRDAIHIAIAPVIAAERLQPGQHIGLTEAGEATASVDTFIGIVDPFLTLTAPVEKGQRFYLCLYPRTVKNLRHDWSHDAIPDRAAPFVDSLSAVWGAQLWVTKFAAQWDYTYDEFMAGAREYVQKDYELDDKWKQLDVSDEDWGVFWMHFHTLTGVSINDKDKPFVTCCP